MSLAHDMIAALASNTDWTGIDRQDDDAERMMQENHILIRGGTIITPDVAFVGDVEIIGEIISAIGVRLLVKQPCVIIHAENCLVLPGLIDSHTHIALDTGIYKTADDWEIGTRTAACGGITTVIDYATQFKGQTLQQAAQNRHTEADGKACIDYALHMMITDPTSFGSLSELRELGIPSVKLYTTYRPNYYADDALILQLLRDSVEAGVLVTVHCENDALVTAATAQLVAQGQTSWRYHAQGRPALAEQEAAHRVLFLAQQANAPVYVVHCSSARTVELVRAARTRGQVAIAETCPQYLLLDDGCYDGDHPERYILQPPLRALGERQALWQLVAEDAVSTIGTDHCDYTLAQKTAVNDFTKTPGGLPGMETMLPLLYTYGVNAGLISQKQLVRLCSANAARIFGLYPRKGNLAPGADADVVIYNPRGESFIEPDKLHAISGYSPYEGWRVQGRVMATISRGQIVYQDGRFIGRPGRGRFVPGKPFNSNPQSQIPNP
jgi:dihydropyrimidinase